MAKDEANSSIDIVLVLENATQLKRMGEKQLSNL